MIAGGLSFAGIAAAVGMSKLFLDSEFTGMENFPNTNLSNTTETESISDGLPLESNNNEEIENAFGEVEVETNDFDSSPIEEPLSEEVDFENEYEYSISFESDAAFANNVEDNMEFSDAFSNARESVGMGGFFNWRDNSYSTYTREEWDSMSEDDKQRFFADVSEQTQLDPSEWTVEEQPTQTEPIVMESTEEFTDEEEIIEELSEEDLEFEEDITATQPQTSAIDSADDVATITIRSQRRRWWC